MGRFRGSMVPGPGALWSCALGLDPGPWALVLDGPVGPDTLICVDYTLDEEYNA